MTIRQEFEAWAIDHGYDVDESKIFGRLYHCDESIRALQVWQAATSHQEAKIKALVEALEQIKHSITQMQMPENDKRREVLLIQNTVAEALTLAKEAT